MHFSLYAVLGVLASRSARRLEFQPWMALMGLLVVFAAGDELHQRWIAGRSADVADWVADAAGVILGSVVYRARWRQELAR